jgi:tetratricopeptide (TPR) repeat protein
MALGLDVWAALAGMGFFLLHPVQTEAVAYISGLSDPLAMTLQLGALVLLTRAQTRTGGKSRWWVAGAVAALMALALLSKESAVVLAPVAVLTTGALGVMQRRRPEPWALAATGVTVVLAGAYSVLRVTVLNFGHGFGLTEAANPYTESLRLRLTTFASVLWDYAGLIVAPISLNYEKPYRAYPDLGDLRGLFGLAVLAALLLAVLGLKRWPRVALAAGAVGAGLLPFTGIVPLNSMYLEHWLYGPMVGMALLVALAAARIKPRVLVLGVAAVFVVAASMRTAVRAADWADPERFYLNELAVAGPSVRVLNNLGMYYADAGLPDKAVEYYRQAIAVDGATPFPQPHHNLARALASAGRLPEAVEELHQALRVDPGFVYSLAFLRDIYTQAGDRARAQVADQALQAAMTGQTYDFPALEAALFPGGGR